MPKASTRAVGDHYTYNHPDSLGYGEHHKAQAGLGDQTAEMQEIDLQDGMDTVYIGTDEDSGWPIVEWTDTVGINRITTIDQASFDQFFVPA